MKVIYKYKINEKEKEFSLPEDSVILKIDAQANTEDKIDLMMWVLQDTSKPTKKRYFVVYGTGEEIKENNLFYHGTVVMNPILPSLVWHVFEKFDKPIKLKNKTPEKIVDI